MDPQNLKNLVGREYKESDENGMYLGCFESLYLMYETLPKYSLDKADNMLNYPHERLLEHFHIIDEDEILTGDVVLFNIRDKFLHCGVYMGEGLILHVCKGHTYQLHRLKLFRKSIWKVLRKNTSEKEGTQRKEV